MKFGLAFANIGPCAKPDEAVALAQAAEAAGIESLWTVEHVVVPSGYESSYPYDGSGKMPGSDFSPIPDPLIWLSFIAAATTTLRLATGILILPQRNPIVLAKELATLDMLSKGRLELGIGVGWLAEEFDAIGVPFNERGARTDDYVAALRTLWAGGAASHHSAFTNFDNCISHPTPVRKTIPVHVGGHTDIAAKRAGRLGDGFFPGKGSHKELDRLFKLVRSTALEHGRDPEAIEMTAGGNGAIGPKALDEVKALAYMGCDRVILPAFLFFANPADDLARYCDEVISQVN